MYSKYEYNDRSVTFCFSADSVISCTFVHFSVRLSQQMFHAAFWIRTVKRQMLRRNLRSFHTVWEIYPVGVRFTGRLYTLSRSRLLSKTLTEKIDKVYRHQNCKQEIEFCFGW
jgi:hypothetical protein